MSTAAAPSGPAPEPAGPVRVREVLAQFRGGTGSSHLAPRIRARVQRKDDVGEVIVRSIQIVVVSIVAVLYLLAPRPADVGLLQSPTPFVLAAYLVLTAGGLLWALRPPVPSAVVYASIALDFVLLYALIWSFHLQYHQPPTFVLKSPTLLYVFLFIALRTLRFEVRYVLAAGVMAALGWAAIIAWVLWADPGQATVTRNYVTYLTSNTILIGAEVDKILLIAFVTAVLAMSQVLAKRLLVASITEAQAAVNFSRFFDPAVASDIRDQEGETAPGEGTLREASILMVDIRRFSTIAAGRPPAEVIGVLAQVHAAVVPIIRDHGGTIDKFMGDGIMATFGAVRETETYAADALRAADAVLDGFAAFVKASADSWFEPHSLGVAAVAGPVIAGIVGVEGRLEFTVIGGTVNLCAKLEKHNKTIGSLAVTTARTLRLARAQGFEAGRFPESLTRLQGIAKPIVVVVLRGGRRGRARGPEARS